MKLNFAVFVWITFMILLFVVGWKERNTVPLRWPVTSLLGRLLGLAGLVAIGALYVGWANRRDFK
jgi:F0F1-type ATP synthase membrane subunit a